MTIPQCIILEIPDTLSQWWQKWADWIILELLVKNRIAGMFLTRHILVKTVKKYLFPHNMGTRKSLRHVYNIPTQGIFWPEFPKYTVKILQGVIPFGISELMPCGISITCYIFFNIQVKFFVAPIYQFWLTFTSTAHKPSAKTKRKNCHGQSQWQFATVLIDDRITKKTDRLSVFIAGDDF
mgnify:CR=1 FL=1